MSALSISRISSEVPTGIATPLRPREAMSEVHGLSAAVSLDSPESSCVTPRSESEAELNRLRSQCKLLEDANRSLLRRLDTVRELHETELQRVRAESAATAQAASSRVSELQQCIVDMRRQRDEDFASKTRVGPATNHLLNKVAQLEAEVETYRNTTRSL
ncbi:hypothetical protein DIPPA_17679 [Diplonema papillatum]|nr:hypothetical protein DIPPA_17679 [Diplonema papillatum]